MFQGEPPPFAREGSSAGTNGWENLSKSTKPPPPQLVINSSSLTHPHETQTQAQLVKNPQFEMILLYCKYKCIL